MDDVVRILMMQVREEQQLRREALQQKTSHTGVAVPTDAEVKSRIEEVKQLLKGEGKVN
jgi:hypothetical protein